MPHHTRAAPVSNGAGQATRTLAGPATHPSAEKAMSLFVPLLDGNSCAPRSTALLDSQQATRPMAGQTQRITDCLREASQETADRPVLRWDVQRLRAVLGEFATPAPEDQ
ncbi:hypothetical protein [Streptomyces sp. NPDC018352]|uniref:hypothetical protein n=1 Tax=Streptomyces sp. NPDC018352 TaxID=3157194 RepID=UPI0033E8651F